MSWRVIVVQRPVVCNVRSDMLEPLSNSFQDIFVEGVINCLSWRYKFFVHNATAVEENNNHNFHPCYIHLTHLIAVLYLQVLPTIYAFPPDRYLGMLPSGATGDFAWGNR